MRLGWVAPSWRRERRSRAKAKNVTRAHEERRGRQWDPLSDTGRTAEGQRPGLRAGPQRSLHCDCGCCCSLACSSPLWPYFPSPRGAQDVRDTCIPQAGLRAGCPPPCTPFPFPGVWRPGGRPPRELRACSGPEMLPLPALLRSSPPLDSSEAAAPGISPESHLPPSRAQRSPA